MNTKPLTTLRSKDFTPLDFDITKQEKFKSIIHKKSMPTEIKITDKVEKCKLRKELRFFITCLKMLGLFHFAPKNSKFTKTILFFKTYSTIIMMLIWFDFFRCFALYSALNSNERFIFLALLYHLRSLICAISITCCYVMSQHGRGWHTFFTAWFEIAKCLDDQEVRRYLENKLRLYLAMIWILVAIIMAFSIYCIAETNVYDIFHWPIDPNSPYFQYLLWAYQIVEFYETCAWIFPTAIVFFLSLALKLEYKQFLQDFQKAVSSSGELQEDIGTFRLRHECICQLTSVVDDMTCVYNGIGGGLALVFVILDLTVVVWYSSIRDNPVVLSLAVFWMFVTLLIISFILIGGGIVNHMVSTVRVHLM